MIGLTSSEIIFIRELLMKQRETPEIETMLRKLGQQLLARQAVEEALVRISKRAM